MSKGKVPDKLITLPKETTDALQKLATGLRMKLKPYMEKVLIDHAVKQKTKKD